MINDMAAAIRAAFDKRARGMEEWIDATVDLARLFANARAQHPSDQAFGLWLTANELDEFGKNDRAALITMGDRPEILRIVLTEGKSTSPELILRMNRRRFPIASETDTDPGVKAQSAPQAVAEPEIVEPPTPANDTAAPGKPGKVPGLVELLGEDVGRPLYQRFYVGGEGSSAMSLLVKVGRKSGGKAALKRYAEVMAAHPEWKPALHQKRMTVALCDAEIDGRNAIERKPTPDGLLKVIARALEVKNARTRPPTPPPNYAKRPPRPEPSERPAYDAPIIVCGKVIREKGQDPESYPMVWAAFRAFMLIDGMVSRAYPNPGSRGTIYGQAVPSLRDVDTDILASVWLQISGALRYGEPDGETTAAPPDMRIKSGRG